MQNDNDINPLKLVHEGSAQPPSVLRGDDGHGGRRDHVPRCCRQGRAGRQRRPHPRPASGHHPLHRARRGRP